jgi:hypothetical protein
MRQAVVDYISRINLGGFTLSREIPWNDSGEPLYLKNPRRIYVDVTNFTNDPLLQTFDGTNIDREVATVTAFFSNDAKQLAANYDDLVSQLKAGKNSIEVVGNHRREVEVSTDFNNDMLVTEVAYRFIKIT